MKTFHHKMLKVVWTLCLFAFVGLSTQNLYASHARAVDLTYTCDPVTGVYTFTLVFYRDCSSSTSSPTNPSLDVTGCGSGSISLSQTSLTDVSVCADEGFANTCTSSDPNALPGTEQVIYTGTFDPSGCTGPFTVSYGLCCRNNSITNLQSASSNDIYVETTTDPSSFTGCNSSPQFAQLPILYTCAGDSTYYNHGVNDPDGDSLSFELIAPRDNATTSINHNAGLSPTTPLTLEPGTVFGFNAATGQMIFQPISGQSQEAVITVLIREYRNGVEIGTVTRDLQVVVLTGCSNTAPSNNIDTTNGGTYVNGNQRFEVCGGNELTFSITVGDADPTDTLSVSSNASTALPVGSSGIPASFVAVGTNPVTATFTWDTDGVPTGLYTFNVIITDNACPTPSQQVLSYEVDLQTLEAKATSYFICPNDIDTIQLEALGFSGAAAPGTYSWAPAAGLSDPNIYNPIAYVGPPTTYTVTYNDGVCTQTAEVDIVAPFPMILNPIPDRVICNGETTILEATSNANNVGTVYENLGDSIILPNSTVDVPLDVSGLPLAALTPRAIESVCVNLNQSLVADLRLFLEAPSGQIIPLMNQRGGVLTTNLTNACFVPNASTASGGNINSYNTFPGIPANNTFYPEGNLSSLTGPANGTWTLRIQHVKPQPLGGVQGLLKDWSITFASQSEASFEWFPTASLSSSTSPSPTAAPTSNTTYTVIATNLFGCKDTTDVTVNLDTKLPTPVISCDPGYRLDSVIFHWGPVIGSASYEVSINSGTPFTVSDTVLSYAVGGLNKGQCVDISVVAISATTCISSDPGLGTCCADTCRAYKAPITLSANTICPLDSAVATAPSGYVSYLWSNGNTTTQTHLFPGTHTLEVVDAFGCIGRDTVTITAAPAVIPVITPAGSTDLCAGDSVLLDAGVQDNYMWNTGETTRTIYANATGQYIVVATSAAGCAGADTIDVTVNTPLLLTMDSTMVSCNGGSDGSAIANVSGGSAPYTIQWSANAAGQTTLTATNLSAGTYTATITDATGCTIVGTVIVEEPTALTGVTTTVANACFGGTDGSASVTATGGTAPYTYLWNDASAQTTSTATNLIAGTYQVTITDANNCTLVETATVTQPASGVSATATLTQDVSCFGGADGSVDVTATGGTAPYTYLWNDASAQTTNTATNLTAGTYTVTVTDANGCTTTAQVTVSEPNALVASVVNTSDESCAGASDGSGEVSVVGGTAPYSYAWPATAASQTTAIATNLSADTYTVTITDANGCTVTQNVTINAPALLTSSTNVTSDYNGEDVSCNGATDGTAEVIPNGGTAPYTFLWDAAAASQTTAIATNLGAGTYTVVVTDANGCTSTSTVTLTEPTPVVASIQNSTDVLCFGDASGSVTVQTSGGTTPYTYLWDDPSGQSTATASNLLAGTYNVTVTDANGCQDTSMVVINQPAAALTATTLVTSDYNGEDVSCNAAADGQAVVNPMGGTMPYLYNWSNGQTTDTLRNVAAGTYNVTVTDANGCTYIDNITLTEPILLVLDSVSATNASCAGNNDGVAEVLAAGGTGAYTYTWSNGMTGNSVTGLIAGVYTITATDANGCTAMTQVTITEPAPLANVTFTTTDVSCAGGSDGTATVSLTGGVLPYTYAWSTGATTVTANGLNAATHTVTVTDANGCTIIAGVSVSEPTPLVLNFTTDSVNCRGGNDGVATVIPVGGVAPYTYNWPSLSATTSSVTGLSAGTYTVVVTDANSCSSTGSVVVGEPAAGLTANILNVTDANCFGAADGSITVNAFGGTQPYTYLWDDPSAQTTVTATGLTAGTYSVVVTDASGCSFTATGTIGQPTEVVVNASVYSNFNGADVSCTGTNDGQARVIATGGSGVYNYAWSNGQTSQVATNLTSGTYMVTVTDGAGCQVIDTVTLVDPVPLAATETHTDISCANGNDGSISVIATAGTGTLGLNGYEYRIAGPGQTGNVFSNINTFTNLQAGTYLVTVRDGNDCETTLSITLTEPTALTASVSSTSTSCNAGSDAEVWVIPTGGTAPYSYSWSNGATTDTVRNLTAGSYTVTVTDANSCSVVETTTVSEPTALALTLDATNVSCNAGNNGTARATVNGGTAPYTYAWSTGSTLNNISGQAAGSYTVTVTDANGCSITDMVTINEPMPLAGTITTTPLTCAGSNDGTATVSITGGTAPYTYVWTDGQTSQTATSLAGTSYNVTAIDAAGCAITLSVSVSEPAPVVVSLTQQTNPDCAGLNTGSATVTATGGDNTFTYLWSNGQTGATATNLIAGAYDVTATDGNGCTSSLTVTITEPSAVVVDSFQTTSVSCKFGNDGTATVFPSGGTKLVDYTYLWSDGQVNQTATGLTAGTYQVTVTDDNGCSTSSQVVVDQPIQALVLVFNADDADCNGQANGAITAIPGGGTLPYTYLWSNGQTTNAITDLAVGTYTLTLTDANGCTVVDNVTISEPSLLTASTSTTGASCNNGNDGTATVTPSGGTVPYTYLWSNGQTGVTATGLATGDHQVTVTDANGCSIIETVTISDDIEVELTATIVDVTCFGDADGSITITNSNKPIALYNWSTGVGNATASSISGLTAGTYTLTVTTAAGCTYVESFVVNSPDSLAVTASQDAEIACHGETTASVNATATGGAAPYTYLWSTGETTAIIDNLAAGTYFVTLTDANGCTASDSVVVTQPLELDIDATASSTTCSDSEDARIIATGFGGTVTTSGYEYSIDGINWQSGDLFSNLGGGDYRVRVRDANGCVAETTTTVESPDLLAFLDWSTDTVITFPDTLVLDASTTYTGLYPVNYTWSAQPNANAGIINVADNILEASPNQMTVYTVSVTDSIGCTIEGSITVNVSKPRVATVANTFTPNGDGANDIIYIQGARGVESVQSFRIYSRWGELVFDSQNVPVNDPTYGWDGTFNGKEMNSGVYAWYAEVLYRDGQVVRIQGDITLLR